MLDEQRAVLRSAEARPACQPTLVRLPWLTAPNLACLILPSLPPAALPSLSPPLTPLGSLLLLQDATQLAVRVVSNYGMSGLGITSYAPMIGRSGPPKGNFEVSGGLGVGGRDGAGWGSGRG